jgi:hypothetical protein
MHRLRHISTSKYLDYFTEGMYADLRLATVFIAILFMGLAAASVLDVNPDNYYARTRSRVRVVKSAGRSIARRSN